MKIKNKCDGERVENYKSDNVFKLQILESIDVIKNLFNSEKHV